MALPREQTRTSMMETLRVRVRVRVSTHVDDGDSLSLLLYSSFFKN